jgi:hypothetical protein
MEDGLQYRKSSRRWYPQIIFFFRIMRMSAIRIKEVKEGIFCIFQYNTNMHAYRGGKFYFNASDVAALLGMHAFKPRCAAILLYMQGQLSRGSGTLGDGIPFPEGTRKVLETNARVLAALNKFSMAKAIGAQVQSMEAAVVLAADEKRDVDCATIVILSQEAARAREKEDARAQKLECEAATAAAHAHVDSAPAVAASTSAREKEAHRILHENPIIQAIPAVKIQEAYAAEAQNEASQVQIDLLDTIAKTLREAGASERARAAAEEAAKVEAARQARKASRASEEAAKAMAQAAALAAISDAKKMEALLRAEVQKKRGRDEEEAVLDAMEKRRNTNITKRNAEFRKFSSTAYAIGGRCDGVENGKIIELKTRRNWFERGPPRYDIVQLQVYLKIFDAQMGVLVEQQQSGPLRRETEVTCTDEEWMSIDNGLVALTEELKNTNAEWVLQLAEEALRS